MSDTPAPEAMMRDAINVAKQAMQRGEAPIGCVLYTHPGERLAQGWNQARSTGDITRHAEMVAFESAAQPGRFQPRKLTLVSTLEPCVMCWGAALELGVSRMVYGLEAPANGGSMRITDPQRQPAVLARILRDDCRQLFVDWQNDHPDAKGSGFIRDLLEATA